VKFAAPGITYDVSYYLTVLLVVQSTDMSKGLSSMQFGGVCKFCGNTSRWHTSVMDQSDKHSNLHCCSEYRDYLDTLNSRRVSDAERLVPTVTSDADDIISPASAAQDNTSSPTYITIEIIILVKSLVKLIVFSLQHNQVNCKLDNTLAYFISLESKL